MAYNLLQVFLDNKGFNTDILTTPKILFYTNKKNTFVRKRADVQKPS